MTNQAKIHELRESEKTRLESARESAKNTLRVTAGGFAAATDRAGRAVVVQLSLEALLRLRDEVAIAISHAAHDDSQPETLRAIEIAGQVVPVGDFDE